ncbi:class A beta-lactamase [Plantibacter sp. CFBP 13570]|uniref:class A beta-lactamase n=1 Tax=Plantibacter sp. CFBP 13570 TaxID=2775272 RepID=UPI0019309F7F|nr:class A beta-lactamase [Plantibacter sp. CFBP 13570]MBD8533651.1 class A beta-lactamase [Plantibacter sp. CFBP 13570]
MTRSTGGVVAVALAGGLVLGLVGCASATPSPSASPSSPTSAPTSAPPTSMPDRSVEFQALEAEFSARVGISAVDTGTGARLSYRADERFGYASTIKALAAAVFLHEVRGSARDEVVTWSAEDVEAAGYSPVTSEQVETGLTLSQLAEAAVRRSDNTALNLVLARIGGPAALDAALGALGDEVTEVVNAEPLLNVIEPGSTDDTTTPAAFTDNLTRLVDGSYLEPADRATLLAWMSGNATGDTLIRAGAPAGWQVADKSGGAGGIRNDIAIIDRPGGDPIVLTILTNTLDPERDYDDALIAAVARVALADFDR